MSENRTFYVRNDFRLFGVNFWNHQISYCLKAVVSLHSELKKKVDVMSRHTPFIALAVLATVVFGDTHVRSAPLTLTPAGIAAGFTLTTYGTGDGGAYNFLAAAVLPNGNLAVIDYSNGLLKSYADIDGQTKNGFIHSVSFPGAYNAANVGGNAYAASQSSGIALVSNSLGLTHVNVPGYSHIYGLAGNPSTGNLLAYGSKTGFGNGIYDINPNTGASTLIAGGSAFDGVSVSPDGMIVYAESAGNIVGYNIATHAQVFFASGGGHSPDGTGVISGGIYNGYIISNNNDGTVTLITPNGSSSTIIASGGTRGDFTSPDLNNGSLLLSELGVTYRLGAPGGSFGGANGTAVPEPASLTILGLVLGSAVGCWRRRRQHATA